MSSDRKPRLLDLFCGAGGAGKGYALAGFEVIGVDNKPQPHYPFEFVLADAMEILDPDNWDVPNDPMFERIDAIHASPPCPRYSSITRVQGNPDEHPDLIEPVRELLSAWDIPHVIENVVGAPLENATTLCGAAFALGTVCKDGRYRHLRRHRLFETSFHVFGPGCACPNAEPIGVYGKGGQQANTVWTGGVNRGYMGSRQEAAEAMGIDWMTRPELSDAIPPAYTQFIGEQLLQHIGGEKCPAGQTLTIS